MSGMEDIWCNKNQTLTASDTQLLKIPTSICTPEKQICFSLLREKRASCAKPQGTKGIDGQVYQNLKHIR